MVIMMETFEQFLTQCGVDDSDNFINFLENLSEDPGEHPPAEIENQINQVFGTIFNHDKIGVPSWGLFLAGSSEMAGFLKI